MLEKILVGTDLSEPSLAVLDYLPGLKELGVREIVLTHVVFLAGTVGLEQTLIDEAERVIAEQAKSLRDAGFEVETVVEVGAPVSRLTQLAEKHGVSALVVGSHGRSMLKRLLLGSVAMGLLQRSTVPVLIVRMNLCETDEGISCELLPQRPHQHLLFPTDFSEAADAAFEWLKHLAPQNAVRVTLLHALDRRMVEPEMAGLETGEEGEQEQLERLAEDLRAAGVSEVRAVVEEASAAPLISKRAAEDDVSLIVMATHGRGALGELVLGSVALQVARKSPVPVLMIPAG